jgi:hypothetical protein
MSKNIELAIEKLPKEKLVELVRLLYVGLLTYNGLDELIDVLKDFNSILHDSLGKLYE